jgi:hypothetical protein
MTDEHGRATGLPERPVDDRADDGTDDRTADPAGTPTAGQGDEPEAARGSWLRAEVLAPLALVLLLALATWIGPGDTTDLLSLANPDRSRVSELRAALARLPDRALVVVAMDADLGTYPEIRTAVRALFEDLLRREARLAFVSLTAEGRAIAAAELARLRQEGAREGSLLDLGFIAGAEAGLVRAVERVMPDAASGPAADAVREAGGGLAAFDLAVVVGGIDLGPRSWVEQVGTRLPELPMVGVAPTAFQPELAPYLRTGQLTALLATLRDAAAYAARVAADRPAPAAGETAPDRVPSSLAMLVGMGLALVALGRALLLGAPRSPRPMTRPADGEDEEGSG